jgi:NitT/TauT family transport system permease protein
MKHSTVPVSAIALPILTAIVFCAAWQALTVWTQIPQVVLPPPTAIGRDFVFSLQALGKHGLISGSEAVGAFLIATLMGALGAAALTYSPLLRDMLYPTIVVFQLIPKVALAPLFIVWLGTDTPARLAFATFLSFFPVLVSTATGLQHADQNAVRLCRSLVASDWQILLAVRVPFAIPHFFSGLKVAATMAVTGIVIAEFITANAGLGYLILLAGSRMEVTKIFSAILMLCVIGLALYGLVLLLEQFARRWYRG